LIVARSFEELEKRSTGRSLDELPRKELRAKSALLSRTLILEIEEYWIQHIGVDTFDVSRHVNVIGLALGGHETATDKDARTSSIAQQAQRRFELRQLLPTTNRRAEPIDDQCPRGGMHACRQQTRRPERRKPQHNNINVFKVRRQPSGQRALSRKRTAEGVGGLLGARDARDGDAGHDAAQYGTLNAGEATHRGDNSGGKRFENVGA